MQTGETIRILIVDDHPVVRAGLASMLGTQSGMQVVGSVSNGQEALVLLDHLAAEVMLIDLRMPGMSGVDTIREVKKRHAATRMIVLTSYETDEEIYRAVQAGAHGYLMKGTKQQEMLEAIRLVHANKRYFPPQIAARLAERMARSSLTPRENEILRMLVKGLTNKEMGRVLGISENTARNHVNSIIEKLQVSDRTEAATTAIQQGLISITD